MFSAPAISRRSPYLVVAFGFFAIFFEGYDLIVYGTAVPTLLAYQPWHLTATEVGWIGGAALLGMVLGAPASGWLADRFGRRKLFIGLLSFFSLMMLFIAAAPTPAILGLCRFLAGLGFGGIPPTAIALAIEFSPACRKALFNAVMLAGFGVGGIVAGGLSVALLEHIGFRGMFALGALPILTLVPLAMRWLPESPTFSGRDRTNPTATTISPLRRILRGRLALATGLYAFANFCSFLIVFDLNTWLPQLMRGAGYELKDALKFLLVLNVGALFGATLGAWIADRIGIRRVATSLYLLAALSLALLAVPASTLANIVVVFLTGAALSGSQTLLWSDAGTYYDPQSRATAIGLTTGIGRIGAAAGPVIGGMLVNADVGLYGNVALLAAASIIGALAVLAIPRMADRLLVPA
jgi:AAHS family benzoate transporter-like MFS transporter